MAANEAARGPRDVDVSTASAARVYDYLLGGAHNFAADRALAEQVIQVLPTARQVAIANRSFLRRAVRYLVGQGITQFLDLGSGSPTYGNVHEIAQEADPACRVLYVDHDEVAVAHSELLLAGNPAATMLGADLTKPSTVLDAPITREFLDFSRPIGLLMIAVLVYVPDSLDPAGIVATYRDALPAGSYFALSHLTADHEPVAMAAVVEAMKNSRDPLYFRSYDETLPLFAGFDLVAPGLVDVPDWRPDPGHQDASSGEGYAGIGRKS
ncbi:SAM-dependent methyltransferase [Kutzneria sp. CA-103260]|uniref:SAM-dependent methyltransferase n=1 Tax=Kutzneria sp. CA-103260 TaxID=2802641 RepID=UPI001BA621D2|nr:SAM-dependent methyltransferase [Kutzneria sp. CA-103260]QUQ62514.1 SAM-dependent methyltransferase [Kutzneria sp. CA-103260]